jgi:GT2 family glycosyltransferase
MIAICTPTREMVYGRFAFDLVQLTRRTKEVAFLLAEGSILPNLRTMLVDMALGLGASHILFIDSDMRFPDDVLEKLLARGVDIVGVNCSQRSQNLPTARRGGEFVRGKGIEEVDTIGFGVTLIAASVFLKISPPWFMNPFDGKRFVGEDVFFMTRARESGLKIYAENDIRVGHIGGVEFYI